MINVGDVLDRMVASWEEIKGIRPTESDTYSVKMDADTRIAFFNGKKMLMLFGSNDIRQIIVRLRSEGASFGYDADVIQRSFTQIDDMDYWVIAIMYDTTPAKIYLRNERLEKTVYQSGEGIPLRKTATYQSANNLWHSTEMTPQERYVMLFLVWRYNAHNECVNASYDAVDSLLEEVRKFTGIEPADSLWIIRNFINKRMLEPAKSRPPYQYKPNWIYTMPEGEK